MTSMMMYYLHSDKAGTKRRATRGRGTCANEECKNQQVKQRYLPKDVGR